MEKRINKNGRAYYYESGRGIVSKKEGLKAYIKDNLIDFTNKEIDNFTPEENKIFVANSRPRYKGRFISKTQERIVKRELKSLGEKHTRGMEINNVFGGRDFFKTIQGQDINFSINTSKETRTGFKIESNVLNVLKSGGNFELTTKDGDILQGLEALTYLRQLNSDAAKNQAFYIHFVSSNLDKNNVETMKLNENESKLIESPAKTVKSKK